MFYLTYRDCFNTREHFQTGSCMRAARFIYIMQYEQYAERITVIYEQNSKTRITTLRPQNHPALSMMDCEYLTEGMQDDEWS